MSTLETSAEVAAIAARILRMDDNDLACAVDSAAASPSPNALFCADIRKVAASALAQREGDGGPLASIEPEDRQLIVTALEAAVAGETLATAEKDDVRALLERMAAAPVVMDAPEPSPASTFEPLVSSNLKGFVYDPATRDLTVSFHSGTMATYPDVAPETVEGLRSAESPGRFFRAHIQGKPVSEALSAGERPLSPRDMEDAGCA